jgi:hypothetical protein
MSMESKGSRVQRFKGFTGFRGSNREPGTKNL